MPNIKCNLQIAYKFNEDEKNFTSYSVTGKTFEAKGDRLAEFECDEKHYKILKESNDNSLIPKSLPMGVIMTGFPIQYDAVDDDGNEVQVYVYYYLASEGRWMAIVDDIKYI